MSIGATCFPGCLAQVWMILLMSHTPVRTSTSPINLQVTHTYDPSRHTGLLSINCSLDASLTNMEKVISLAVLRSRSEPHPVGKDGFDQLAVVDLWSQNPKLVPSELESASVAIEGKIGLNTSEQSYVKLSWSTLTPGQLYKCVAGGMDSNRTAEVAAATEKVQLLSLDKTVNYIDRKLQLLSTDLGNASSAIGQVLQHVQTVPDKIDAQDVKFEELLTLVKTAVRKIKKQDRRLRKVLHDERKISEMIKTQDAKLRKVLHNSKKMSKEIKEQNANLAQKIQTSPTCE